MCYLDIISFCLFIFKLLNLKKGSRKMQKKLLKTEEVAELLGIAQFTVRKYIRQGKIKAVKLGKRFLVTEEQVQDFLEQHIYEIEKGA